METASRYCLLIFLLFGAVVSTDWANRAGAQEDGVIRVERRLHDDHLRCDGDSARFEVRATRDGRSASGVRIVIHLGGTAIELITNNAGRAATRITPRAGSSGHFVYIVSVPHPSGSGYRHLMNVGYCPFVPGDDTGTVSGVLVDHTGRAVHGEPVSAAIHGYSAGSTIPAHWVRSGSDGAFSWEGVPRWWNGQHPNVIEVVCLAADSKYVFVSIEGVPLASPDSCVPGPLLNAPPLVYGVQRKSR
jgi:hypothetical protein